MARHTKTLIPGTGESVRCECTAMLVIGELIPRNQHKGNVAWPCDEYIMSEYREIMRVLAGGWGAAGINTVERGAKLIHLNSTLPESRLTPEQIKEVQQAVNVIFSDVLDEIVTRDAGWPIMLENEGITEEDGMYWSIFSDEIKSKTITCIATV